MLGDSGSGLQFFDPHADRSKLVPVVLFDLGSALGEFGLEPEPDALLVLALLPLEQSEGLLCAELRDSCEVLRAEPIQNLSASECARARAQWAFDGLRVLSHPHTVRSVREIRPVLEGNLR